MYDELVKRLRELASIPEHCENVESCDGCSKEEICLSFTNKRIIEVATQAADAIEELTGFVQEAERDRDEYQERLDKANDAIEELQRVCNAMKPKHDAVCVKCAYYAEAEHNEKGFLICPASGMDITAWDFCSYFEPPKEG